MMSLWLYKMRKLIFLIFLFFFINFILVDAFFYLYLEDEEDKSKISQDLKFIKDNYGIEIVFYVEDGSFGDYSVIKGSLEAFYRNNLNLGNMKNYNLLVYYDVKKNDLRFVTYRHCSLGNENLQKIKGMEFVKNVVNRENPSKEDISKMFLGISNEIRRIIEEINPNPNICIFDYYEEKINLRSNEYVVPNKVLRAMYIITMEGSDWESANPGGLYVSRNFMGSNVLDFLPVITSNKEKFVKLLKEKTELSSREIESYYKIVTTKGNIVMGDDYDQSKLFHERIHKIISENLNDNERSILISVKNDFLYGKSDYFGNSLLWSITVGDWQEIYAYMAQYEKYSQSQNQDQFIDPEIYNKLSSEYPEAYKIYKRAFDLANYDYMISK